MHDDSQLEARSQFALEVAKGVKIAGARRGAQLDLDSADRSVSFLKQDVYLPSPRRAEVMDADVGFGPRCLLDELRRHEAGYGTARRQEIEALDCGDVDFTGRTAKPTRKISSKGADIIKAMKQLLLRVPEDLHRRLSARAGREHRSVNSLAGEILDAAVDADRGDRRARLRAAAVASGIVPGTVPARAVGVARRRRIIESTRGLGAQVDRLIDEERNRV